MYDVDELIQIIADRWQEIGAPPAINSEGLPSSSTYYHRFEGGFREARGYAARQLDEWVVWECKYCGRPFEIPEARNGHHGWCELNPNGRNSGL